MNQIKYFGPVNALGVPQGYGRLLYPSEDTRREYVGNFANGKRGGYGILQWKDGCVYAGEWANDIQRGWGKLRFSERDQFNRESYEGEWFEGKRSGKGTLIFRSGDRYEGEWRHDKYHGKGEFIWYGECSGIKYRYQYIGEWIEGRRNENVGSFKVTPLATGISKDVHVQNLESEFVQNLANHPFHSTNKRKVIPLSTETTFDATHLLRAVPTPRTSSTSTSVCDKLPKYEPVAIEGDPNYVDFDPSQDTLGWPVEGDEIEVPVPADTEEETESTDSLFEISPSEVSSAQEVLKEEDPPLVASESFDFFQDLVDQTDPIISWDQQFCF